MMSSHVVLRIIHGALAGTDFGFDKRAHLMLGRAEDCDIRLPLNYENSDVSRHHCVFDIDPPAIQVRDLGSRNGTYLNGMKIGIRPIDKEPEEADLSECPAWELHDGDEVQVGQTIIRVEIDAVTEIEDDPGAVVYCV